MTTASKFTWAIIDSSDQELMHYSGSKRYLDYMQKILDTHCAVIRIEWRCAASTEEELAAQNQKAALRAENDALRDEILELKEGSKEMLKMVQKTLQQMIRCLAPNEEQAEAFTRDVIEEFRRLTEGQPPPQKP